MPVSRKQKRKSRSEVLPTETLDQALKALSVLSRTARQVLEVDAACSIAGKPLSPTRVQVIRLLGHQPDRTPGQVARFLGITKAAVTQTINPMVRDGLITRTQAEHDRREFGLALTPAGRQCFMAIRRRQRHLMRSAFREMSEADAVGMIAMMETAAINLAAAGSDFETFCAQCGAHENDTCVLKGGDADCAYRRHA